jgi:hypothetical protein
MRPRLKVNCYKKSGKWAYSNMTDEEKYPEIPEGLYPTLIGSYGKQPTRTELWDMQSQATYKLGQMIRENNPCLREFSPERFGFRKEYIYVIELIIPDHYSGFCQFIMDNTGE